MGGGKRKFKETTTEKLFTHKQNLQSMTFSSAAMNDKMFKSINKFFYLIGS